MARKKTAPKTEDVVEGIAEDVTEAVSDEITEDEPVIEAEPEIEEVEEVAVEDVIPEPEHVSAPVEKIVERRGGFGSMALGGAVAAALGFGASQYTHNAWPFGTGGNTTQLSEEIGVLGAQLSDARTKIDAQTAELETLRSSLGQVTTDATEAAKTSVTEATAPLSAQLETIGQQVTALEKRPQVSANLPEELRAGVETQMEEIRTRLDDELVRLKAAEEEAARLEAEAAAAAKAARVRAALAKVEAAVDAGVPFADPLEELAEGAEITPALAESAQTGVPRLDDLQRSFPKAARAALSATAVTPTDGNTMDKVSAFFKNQLGARSLEPKEGSDPDAILSRAEAALRAGDTETTLTEIAALPEAGQEKMADWVAKASQRQNAVSALKTLTDAITN